MDRTEFGELLTQMEWADAQTWRAIRALRAAQSDERTKWPYYPSVRAFANTVDASKFSQPVDFPWSAMIAEKFGKILPATLSESAWQVLSHTTYHRGQIATRIRELGGEPPLVDFLYWVWAGKPAPEW